jgi:ACR3 family arsenite transporter
MIWCMDGRGIMNDEVKQMSIFERYLTIWVAVCMIAGVVLGKLFPSLTAALSAMEFAEGSHVNIPIVVLIWLMIFPMMLKIDFSSILQVGKNPKGLFITLFVNWMVKPFSMFLLGLFFFKVVFAQWISPEQADQFMAGVIILAAAPCTAMVFVWSHLTDGDPAYTLVQVAINDLLMLVLFVPVVGLLLGVSGVPVNYEILLISVGLFVVLPLAVAYIVRRSIIASRGIDWFENRFVAFFQPITIIALLITLVTIFAFQAENITEKAFFVILIAVPILIQVYFNSGLVYGLMKFFKVPHSIAAPGALIGASNFFELAVATAIALYGPGSGAALATVVGVLVEVPVMLTVCNICNRTRHWFPTRPG